MAIRSHRWVSCLLLTVGLGFWTLAPYGGCSCHNPLGNSSAPQTTQVYGGTKALSLDHTLNPNGTGGVMVVDDFEDGATSSSATGHWQNEYINGQLKQVWFNGNNPKYRVNLWGGATYTQNDAFGTSSYASSLIAGYQSVGALEYGPGWLGRATIPSVCSGITSCGQIYPFVQHGLYLSPQGAAGDACVVAQNQQATATGSAANWKSWAANHGLEFYFQNSVPAQALQVRLELLWLYQYTYAPSTPCNNADTFSYHTHNVSPGTDGTALGGGWYLIKIPFSSFKLGAYQLGEGTQVVTNGYLESHAPVSNGADLGLDNIFTWQNQEYSYSDGLHIMGIEFDPTAFSGTGTCSTLANNFSQMAYNYSIDYIAFY
jgi:hypothetical protein